MFLLLYYSVGAGAGAGVGVGGVVGSGAGFVGSSIVLKLT